MPDVNQNGDYFAILLRRGLNGSPAGHLQEARMRRTNVRSKLRRKDWLDGPLGCVMIESLGIVPNRNSGT